MGDFSGEEGYSLPSFLTKNHQIAHLLIFHRFGVATIATLVELTIVLIHVRAALALRNTHDNNAATISYVEWSLE